MAKDKRTKHGAEPAAPHKAVRFGNDPTIEGGALAWRFSGADKQGAFACDLASLVEAGTLGRLVVHLAAIESLTLGQLREHGSHPIKINGLAPVAAARLREIRLDDFEELFSLRVTGRERLWCIQDRNVMRVLWWDPEHQVCPSIKKHT